MGTEKTIHYGIEPGAIETIIEMGSGQSIVLDKLYGPTVFANLRITADAEKGWVIERELGDDWVEWCVIPAQLPQDFLCDECETKTCKNEFCSETSKADFCSEKCRNEFISKARLRSQG